MATKIINNYDNFKTDFKKDTGLEVKDNLELYIQYFNARSNDISSQILRVLTHDLVNEVKQQPDHLVLRMMEALRSNKVIK